MWERTSKLQFWWQCPITFGQNPKTFRINSDSLFGKSSPFYVECSFTENCRTFCPQSPKAFFAVKIPCTRWKKIWQVFRKFLLKNPKLFAHIGKALPKSSFGQVEWSLTNLDEIFCSQSSKIIQAKSEKHFSQTVMLDSLQNAVFTTLLKTFRSTSGCVSGTVRKPFPEYTLWTRRKQLWQTWRKFFPQTSESVQESISQQRSVRHKKRSFGTTPNEGTQKAVLTNVSINICWKPTKRSINLLPKNDPSDINDWVLTTLRTFTDQSPKAFRSDSERKITEVIIWTRGKQFWQLSRSFLVETRKMFQKLFLNNILSDKYKGVLTNLLKTPCSKTESLLRRVKIFFQKCSSRHVRCSS